MKIFTSYFANSRAFGKEGVIGISIARYSPKWFSGPRLTIVAPTSFMLSGACSHDEYLKKYDEILSRLDPKQIVAMIDSISRGKDVALCCYEKPGDFCHRHLLSEWFRKNGYEVEEWTSKETKEQAKQLSLFE